MDAYMLARIQFAANISFHILFPSITIALGWVLFFFKVKYNRTKDKRWMEAYRFWVKVFALSFSLGVVSGVTMSFQFGTNWPGFMNKVGNIAGPLLGYEVLVAFFLEASFLGIMLFGMKRVSQRTHTIATFLVAFGTTLSAFFIIALNSWMQTPVGFEMRNGQAYPVDWWQIIFNPSMPYRLVHMLLASGLTAAFLIAGVSAYRVLRGDRSPGIRLALRTGVFTAAVLMPLQILAGDMHGLNTLQHQPAKIAAMEAVWQTEKNVPFTIFALPDEINKRNDYAVELPNMASLILTHSFDGEVRGLNEFEGKHPPVAPVFFAFRIMIAMGILMLLVSWICAWKLRSTLDIDKFWAKVLVAMTFSGWVAVLAGWYTTEIGRQPYLVYGLLTTAEAASDVPAGKIGISLAIYLTLYAGLLYAYIHVLFHMARQSAEDLEVKVKTKVKGKKVTQRIN